jgi:hypothetical protein
MSWRTHIQYPVLGVLGISGIIGAAVFVKDFEEETPTSSEFEKAMSYPMMILMGFIMGVVQGIASPVILAHALIDSRLVSLSVYGRFNKLIRNGTK